MMPVKTIEFPAKIFEEFEMKKNSYYVPNSAAILIVEGRQNPTWETFSCLDVTRTK